MRGSVVKVAVVAAVGALAAIQLVPVDRSNPPIGTRAPASPEVQGLLRRACNDCHSNETVWPWYSRVAPVSWWVAGHVHEGRTKLNLSAWATPLPPQAAKRLGKTPKELAKGEMPPWYYRLAHPEARLSPQEVATLSTWAGALAPPASAPAPTAP